MVPLAGSETLQKPNAGFKEKKGPSGGIRIIPRECDHTVAICLNIAEYFIQSDLDDPSRPRPSPGRKL
jgi:hypothetical protein